LGFTLSVFTLLTYPSVPQVGGAVVGALGVAGAAYGLKKHHDNQNNQDYVQQGEYLTWIILSLLS
jgi:hypothetical protein